MTDRFEYQSHEATSLADTRCPPLTSCGSSQLMTANSATISDRSLHRDTSHVTYIQHAHATTPSTDTVCSLIRAGLTLALLSHIFWPRQQIRSAAEDRNHPAPGALSNWALKSVMLWPIPQWRQPQVLLTPGRRIRAQLFTCISGSPVGDASSSGMGACAHSVCPTNANGTPSCFFNPRKYFYRLFYYCVERCGRNSPCHCRWVHIKRANVLGWLQ